MDLGVPSSALEAALPNASPHSDTSDGGVMMSGGGGAVGPASSPGPQSATRLLGAIRQHGASAASQLESIMSPRGGGQAGSSAEPGAATTQGGVVCAAARVASNANQVRRLEACIHGVRA